MPHKISTYCVPFIKTFLKWKLVSTDRKQCSGCLGTGGGREEQEKGIIKGPEEASRSNICVHASR